MDMSIKKLMEIDKNIKILLISASLTKEKMLECLQAGVRGYFIKPLMFNDDEFCETFTSKLNKILGD